MSTYDAVKKAMAAGTPLELICASCPWDRLCVQPPKMSSADIDDHIKQAEEKDKERDPLGSKLPTQMLLTTLMFAGKDAQGELCPVFSARMKSPEGRQIADAIRSTMRQLGDAS